MTNKETTISELRDLIKHNQQHTSLVNAVIAALGDKWNDVGINQQLKAMDVYPCPQGYHKDANGVCVPDVG